MANAQLAYDFLPTSRNGRYLIVGGYKYRINKRKTDTDVWKCTTKACNTTAITSNDILIRVNGDHNHEDARTDIRIHETISKLRDSVKSSLKPIPTLYSEEMSRLREWNDDNTEIISSMPTFWSKKNTLYRSRHSVLPKLPASRSELDIPDEFQQTKSGEMFLCIDDGTADRILGFSTPRNLHHLAGADFFYGDGTFYVCPKLFYQMYSIHAMVDGVMFPLCFFFLPDKREETYTRMFTLLRNKVSDLGHRLSPRMVQMDFEIAAKKALMTVFPDSQWKGCFFHYTQCIWRRTQQCGLQRQYGDDADITRFVRRCAVLPMVPSNMVEEVFVNAMSEMPNDPRLVELADYVTTQWLEGVYGLNEWNHYGSEAPRTNNNLEGWHSRVKKLVGKAHPNIFEIINFLKEEQNVIEIRMMQYAGGQQQPPKKRKYRTLEARLLQNRQQFINNNVNVFEFADSVSHLLKLK